MSHGPVEAEAAGLEVVSVSEKNPKVRTVRVARLSPAEATYIIPTLKGMRITVGHFFRNVLFKKDTVTLQYPEEDRENPERFRGRHRLMLREDGETVRCVACMMCPTVCPANCITIVPEESADPNIEKRPAIFELDTLRCVVCGLCVEACPCDAIRMDTDIHPAPVEQRSVAVLDKQNLLEGNEILRAKEKLVARNETSTATQGGAGPDWRNK